MIANRLDQKPSIRLSINESQELFDIMDEKKLSDRQIDSFQEWNLSLVRRKWEQVPLSLTLSQLLTKQVTTLKMVVLDNSARFFHFRQQAPFQIMFQFFFSRTFQNQRFEQPHLAHIIDESGDEGAQIRRVIQVRLPMMWENIRAQLVKNGSLQAIDKFARRDDFSNFGYGLANCGRYMD